MRIRHILSLLCLVALNAMADDPRQGLSPYFNCDSELLQLRDTLATNKPIWVNEDAAFFQGNEYRDFENDPIYGNLKFRKMSNRRALAGDHCMVNKLITEVGVGNWSKNIGNLTDEDLDNYAEFNKVIGVGVTVNPFVSVRDCENYYAAGSKAGFCVVASSGDLVLSLDVIQALSIGFYRDGKLLGTKAVTEGQDGSGVTLSLVKIPGSEDACMTLTAESDWVFDEISLDPAGGVNVSVAKLMKVKYAFVGKAREYPITHNATYTAGGLKDWNSTHQGATLREDYYKGFNAVLLGLPFPLLANEVNKMRDTDLGNYASITPIIAIGYQGGAKWMVKDDMKPRKEVFPAGTEVGFCYKYGSGLTLDLGAWVRLITFDRDGNKVQEETVKGNVLGLSLAKGGEGTSSFTTDKPFSGCELRFHTIVSLDLGAIGIHYGFVREKPDIFHRCDIRPMASSNVCEDNHSFELLSNPDVKVTWRCVDRPQDDTTMEVTAGGLVTKLETPGDYTFEATAEDGCTDRTVVHYNMFGENAAIRSDGTLNEGACGQPIVNELGVGQYAVSDEIYDSSGSLLSVSGITGKEHIVEPNFNTYAEYTSGLNIADNLSIIGVKRIDGEVFFKSSMDKMKRIGFVVEADVTGLDLSALQFLQIRCYHNGTEVYKHVIAENNAVSAGIAGSDNMQKVRYSIELPRYNKDGSYYEVDEFQLWTSGVLNLGGSRMRIYYAFIEDADKNCADPTGCSATVLSERETHTTLNGNATQYGAAISVASTVNNIYRFLDGNLNTCMTLALPVNAGGVTIAVNLGRTADYRHWLGIVTDNKTYLASIGVGNWLTARTYFRGQPTGDEMTDWSVVGANVAGYGDKNFLYVRPKQPYDEVRLEIAGVVSALDVQNFYGLFLRDDADGDGLPDCQDTESCPVRAKQNPTCVGQDVVIDLKTGLSSAKTYALTSTEPGFVTERNVVPDENVYIEHRHRATTPGREFILSVYDEVDRKIVQQVAYSVRPTRTEWRTNTPTANWQNWDNWTDGIPYCCTDVVIPSDADLYPELTEDITDTLSFYCCDNIFIAPRGRLEGPTTKLNYRRAWVELGQTANHYRLFSPPLKNIYTGDMFVPAGLNGVQTGDYFMELTPETCPENRFDPSVYQRFWANTVNDGQVSLNPGHSDQLSTANITVDQPQWTREVNAVNYRYPMGQAASIWVDNGALPATGEFRIRFPKTHTSYQYYSDYDRTAQGSQPINRMAETTDDANRGFAPHRFIYEDAEKGKDWSYIYSENGQDVAQKRVMYKNDTIQVTLGTSEGQTTDKFLLGNPFMSRIYLAPFFESNEDIVSVELDGGGTVTRDNLATTSTQWLAPMEGMFVKTATAQASVNVKLTTAMALPGAAPATNPAPQLRVDIAHGTRSASMLLVDEDVSHVATIDGEVAPYLAVFACTEDARACDIAPSDSLVSLGIIAPDTATVSFSFHSSNQFPRDDYFVLDRATGKRYFLDDDILIENAGNSAGRIVLVRGDIYTFEPTAIQKQTMDVSIASRNGMITATGIGTDLHNMMVYNLAGRLVATAKGPAQTLEVRAPRGVVIVCVDGKRIKLMN